MIRYTLLFALLLGTTGITLAQTKIGIRFSPSISTNRIESLSDTASFNSDGTSLRYVFGPVAELGFGENYFFTIGVQLANKRTSFKVLNRNTNLEESEFYKLSYIQIPLGLKLYTNELALDTRIYFQTGFQGELLINDSRGEREFRYVEKFRDIEASFYLAAGVDYSIGADTRIQLGLGYTRGLTNVAKNTLMLDEPLEIGNDLLTIDFHIIF